MELTQDGAEHLQAAIDPSNIAALEDELASLSDRPGARITGLPGLAERLSASGPIGGLIAPFLGGAARPVRALFLNKTETDNWSLGWHQDRTIAVRHRADVPGYARWTLKAGLQHVEPPFALLQRMLTIRIHLDPVGPDNAPLLIVPGSHRIGRVPEAAIPAIVERLGTAACLAERGDAWLYSTPILHASRPATAPRSRRVLQVDYSADDLPEPLEWLGV